MKKAKRKTKSPRASSVVDQYIGTRMREGRRAINMTQANLGEKLGVTFQQIQKYEKGRNRVSAARLFEICKALNVTLASMFKDNPTAWSLGVAGLPLLLLGMKRSLFSVHPFYQFPNPIEHSLIGDPGRHAL
jgi:transcriptional regulator with XRE-family HTH domain